MIVTLLGEPKSTNNLYRYACRGNFPTMYMTSEGRALKEDYQWQAKSQFHGEPLSERLAITVTLYFGRRGRRDWDNFHKISQDALSGIVWEDDEQIDEAVVVKRYDRERPRIEIEIRE